MINQNYVQVCVAIHAFTSGRATGAEESAVTTSDMTWASRCARCHADHGTTLDTLHSLPPMVRAFREIGTILGLLFNFCTPNPTEKPLPGEPGAAGGNAT